LEGFNRTNKTFLFLLIGILKGRFSFLKGISYAFRNTSDLKEIILSIYAVATLHNLLVEYPEAEEWYEADDEEENGPAAESSEVGSMYLRFQSGVEFRHNLMVSCLNEREI
jgi:hypothetical protein